MLVPLIALVLLLAGPPQRDCRYDAQRSASVAVAGARTVEVRARAGQLRVEGRPDLTEVRVRGRACASSESILREIDMRLERHGDAVVLEAILPEGGWNGGYARLDLTVEVPEGMAADIDDTSGGMVLDGLGALVVKDGSGGMEIHDVRGDLRIDDGSGEIRVDRVAGSVHVRDGSGSMTFDRVDRDVIVDDDGSGSIDATHVGGDFVVRDDGSGGIHWSDVRGKVDIPRRHH